VENDRSLTPAQQRVLGVLAAAEHPMTLAEVMELTGLHRNTLRGHLDALLAAERVTRVPRPTGRRGRPAWAYLARAPEYAALAHALAAALEQAGEPGSPGDAAARGGREWGRRVRAQLEVDPDADETDEAARARLLLALEHTGFAPEVDGETIRLTQCPLLGAAHSHGEVVCGAHLGLIEGVLGTAGGVTLLPFAEPGACHVTLTP
jgi:predicted ArsR family transcriptional regulator